ncbi:unnamed protein product [Trichobilharzia regenti]|nr:unnamed protein product [Trichobilharzia regenti]
MKNIEATEEAKQVLLKKRFVRKHDHFKDEIAPINMAVNFVQHSRWNNYTSGMSRKADMDSKRELNQITDNEKTTSIGDNSIYPRKDRRRSDCKLMEVYTSIITLIGFLHKIFDGINQIKNHLHQQYDGWCS